MSGLCVKEKDKAQRKEVNMTRCTGSNRPRRGLDPSGTMSGVPSEGAGVGDMAAGELCTRRESSRGVVNRYEVDGALVERTMTIREIAPPAISDGTATRDRPGQWRGGGLG
jgi:hypothetical protein